jgi:hypothetical protein
MERNFEEWWATMEPGFSGVQPVLMLAFKEIARKAYEAGISDGWNAAVEAYNPVEN